MAWIVSLLFGSLSLYVVGLNYACIWINRRGERNVSAIPLVGGLLGALAVAVAPVDISPWWSLLPLLLDYTVPLLLAFLASGGMWR